MSYVARLCNSTPLDVVWKYHKGVVIKVPPYGHYELTSQMFEQFLPDQPGADAISQELNFFGLFLRDTSRTYESQAEEALGHSIRIKEELLTQAVESTQRRAAESGYMNEEKVRLELENAGYIRLEKDIEKLKETHRVLRAKTENDNRTMHSQYDPTRTLLFTNPPREFESATAMELFLRLPENAELRKQQNAFTHKLNYAELQKEKAAAESTEERKVE